MKTATIALTGERVGLLWIGPTGDMLMRDADLRVDIEGCVAVLKVVEVVDEGVVVRRKVKADYDYDDSRATAKVGVWGSKCN